MASTKRNISGSSSTTRTVLGTAISVVPKLTAINLPKTEAKQQPSGVI
jgi:hypothetical protein